MSYGVVTDENVSVPTRKSFYKDISTQLLIKMSKYQGRGRRNLFAKFFASGNWGNRENLLESGFLGSAADSVCFSSLHLKSHCITTCSFPVEITYLRSRPTEYQWNAEVELVVPSAHSSVWNEWVSGGGEGPQNVEVRAKLNCSVFRLIYLFVWFNARNDGAGSEWTWRRNAPLLR